MSSAFSVCPQSFTFCTDTLLQCFPNFWSQNLSRWTAVLPQELTESQIIFIHIAIALHIPSLEISVPLYAIASLTLHALMSSKIQCWHLKYCHWHGWCVSEFSPLVIFLGLFANLGSSDGYFFCISYTCCAFLRCIFKLCFANINGTVLIIVALSHVHPMSCPPAAPKDLCSTLDITVYCITAVKYEKKKSLRAFTAFTRHAQTVT